MELNAYPSLTIPGLAHVHRQPAPSRLPLRTAPAILPDRTGPPDETRRTLAQLAQLNPERIQPLVWADLQGERQAAPGRAHAHVADQLCAHALRLAAATTRSPAPLQRGRERSEGCRENDSDCVKLTGGSCTRWKYDGVWHTSLGEGRSQLLLLPDSVDYFVGPENPVRFIDAFVDGLDLAGAGFRRVEPKATGRPRYDPADLLKLYTYGT